MEISEKLDSNIIELARLKIAELKSQIDPEQMQGDNLLNNNVHEEEFSKLSFSSASTLSESASAPNYIINNILESDSHGLLAGAPQSFKSFLALHMAYCIANGINFFGHTVFYPRTVVYVCGEGRGALSRRLRAIEMNLGPCNDNLLVLDQSMYIDNDHDISELAIEIAKMRPGLVIFDTFSSMNSKTQENDNSAVSAVLSKLKNALSNGFTSSLIVHHFGKDIEKGVRGASAFTGNSDFIIIMERGSEMEMTAVMSSHKIKDGDGFEKIELTAEALDIGLVRQDGTNSTSLVLSCPGVSWLDRFRPKKKPGPKNKRSLAFWEAFSLAIADEPVEIMGEKGVNEKYFCTIFKNSVGLKSDSALRAFREEKAESIKSKKLIQINNVLIKK